MAPLTEQLPPRLAPQLGWWPPSWDGIEPPLLLCQAEAASRWAGGGLRPDTAADEERPLVLVETWKWY